MDERRFHGWAKAVLILVIVVACLRVASTVRAFSETQDEPVHIAAGYDWHKHGTYTFDPSHPPLARIFFGLASARIDRIASPATTHFIARGNALLYSRDRYRHNLGNARLGNLPFLALAIIATALWARRHFGRGIALLAAALVSSLPPILGHAGLATTDLAIAAMLPLLLHAFEIWLEQPSSKHAILFGLAGGLALVSKFSAVVFFPVAALVIIACWWLDDRRNSNVKDGEQSAPHMQGEASPEHARLIRKRAGGLCVAAAATVLLVWSVYRFDVGRVPQTAPPRTGAERVLHSLPFPAPQFIAGVRIVRAHDAGGHLSYLFGQLSPKGWWYYFPVVLFYKTPLPFLLFAVIGAAVLFRDAWRARRARSLRFVLIPLAMLLVVMPASINIGVRHILPLYPPLAIVAACGAAALWRWRGHVGRSCATVLLLWLFGAVAFAHPDYLPWFNEAAGAHPEHILADSNLDWGQDVLRLADATRELRIDKLSFLYFGNAELARHGINAVPLEPYRRTGGWLAVSETALALTADRFAYAWLDDYKPVRRIGKSIRLYHIAQ
jgi:4-amino-4-deoxy-L-arabinose transferase-like glycosyltransferase